MDLPQIPSYARSNNLSLLRSALGPPSGNGNSLWWGVGAWILEHSILGDHSPSWMTVLLGSSVKVRERQHLIRGLGETLQLSRVLELILGHQNLVLECVYDFPGGLVTSRCRYRTPGVGLEILHFWQAPSLAHAAAAWTTQSGRFLADFTQTSLKIGLWATWGHPCIGGPQARTPHQAHLNGYYSLLRTLPKSLSSSTFLKLRVWYSPLPFISSSGISID